MATRHHARKQASTDRAGHNSREMSVPRSRDAILADGYFHIPAPSPLVAWPLCLEIPKVYLDTAHGIAAVFEGVPDLARSLPWVSFFAERLQVALASAAKGDFADLATYIKQTPEGLLTFGFPHVAMAGLLALNGRWPRLAKLLRRPKRKPFNDVYRRLWVDFEMTKLPADEVVGLCFDPRNRTARTAPLTDAELVELFAKYQAEASQRAEEHPGSEMPTAASIRRTLRRYNPLRVDLPLVLCPEHNRKESIIHVSIPLRDNWDRLGVVDLARVASEKMVYVESVVGLTIPGVPDLVPRHFTTVDGRLALHCSTNAAANFEPPANHQAVPAASMTSMGPEAEAKGILGTMVCSAKGCTILVVEPAKVGIKDDLTKYKMVQPAGKQVVEGDECGECFKGIIPGPYEKGQYYWCPRCGAKYQAAKYFDDPAPTLELIERPK